MSTGLANQEFRGRVIDDAPLLLEQSYRLRYRVYCLQRHFLRAEDYPLGLEHDRFDRYSVHVGVLDPAGDLCGTARLVSMRGSGCELPLFRHCTVLDHHTELQDSANSIVEISRLAIGRRSGTGGHRGSLSPAARRRAFETLLIAIYQTAKRIRATHWVAATEKSLQRRVEGYGFPFRAIGPESDYGGPVRPYLMNLAEFDSVILSDRHPMLEDFLMGLEPEFRPYASRDAQLSAVQGGR